MENEAALADWLDLWEKQSVPGNVHNSILLLISRVGAALRSFLILNKHSTNLKGIFLTSTWTTQLEILTLSY